MLHATPATPGIAPAALVSAALIAACATCNARVADVADASEMTTAGTRSIVHPRIWPRAQRATTADRALAPRIEALLRSMTIEEKVGQIIQADARSATAEDVRSYRLGALVSGGDSGPAGAPDLAPPSQWLQAADAYYLASMDTSAGGHAIPILWGIDAVHGHNNVVGATLFPHNIGLGATRNPALIRRIGEITAIELRVTGQDWTFAPTLAVARDLRWGRTYESYSEDPRLVRGYASAIVQGLQGTPGEAGFLRGNHVIATAKHFVGDGATLDGHDQGDAPIDERELRDIHGGAYVKAISAGVQTIMASYSSWQGRKLHGHRGLLEAVLKRRMGFDGFVLGDWNGHAQVAGCSEVSCAAAILAGVDMLMAPDGWKALYASTLAQVRSGEIPRQRLDEAVRRILRVKLRAGLFQAGQPSARPLAGRFDLLGSAAHRAVAREAVRESLVLLKNSRGVLPLRPGIDVLVAGDGADNLPKQSGGWTLSWQGTGTTNADFPGARSIYAGIAARVRAAGGTAHLSVEGHYERKPAAAIVVFGEEPYAESRGDLATLEYQPGQRRDLALLRRLRADAIPVISVFLSGRPLWVDEEIEASDAFVAAWLPGSEGDGVADVLFANPDGSIAHDFKGRLPFAWPRPPMQAGAGRREAPLFARGHGLRYGAHSPQ